MAFKILLKKKKTHEEKLDEEIAELDPTVLEARRAYQREHKKSVETDETGIAVTRNRVGAVKGRHTDTPMKVNWDHVDKLLHIQATQYEVAGFLNISVDTIRRRCKQDHGITFKKYAEAKRAGGCASLRRKQWLQADKSSAMAIHLGKQYLGQADKIEATNHNVQTELDLTKLGSTDLDKLESILEKAEMGDTE